MRVTGKAQSDYIESEFLEYVRSQMLGDYPELLDTVGAHFLKTVEPHYKAVTMVEDEDGHKKAELRFDDRDYRVGDFLCLERYPYDGHYAFAYVTHKLSHADYPQGLVEGFCMLSIDVVRVFGVATA